jgi:hypothetical protein
MIESLFERLVVAVEAIVIEMKKKVELAETWVQVELREAKDDPAFVKGPSDDPELPEEEKPVGVVSLKSYEELLEEHGLPYLKELCEERGLNFPKLARSNAIIALLKDSDKETGSCLPEEKMKDVGKLDITGIMVADPFAVQTPVVEDPFATTPAPEPVKEVTEEELRDKLKDLRDVFESKNAGKGTPMIIEFMEKTGGVRILKELPKEKYAAVMKAANDEILRILK